MARRQTAFGRISKVWPLIGCIEHFKVEWPNTSQFPISCAFYADGKAAIGVAVMVEISREMVEKDNVRLIGSM
jgi:hypothetical protein